MKNKELKNLRLETEKKAVFMMGSPASGKSRTAAERFSDLVLLDCDHIKKSHPEYDPKNPQLIHHWSSQKLEEKFQTQILENDSFVVDGTGGNSDRLVRRINEAKEHGFKTELVYVIVSLKVALERNARRERTVPETTVIEKFKDIRVSFELAAPHADNVTVVNNS